MPSFTRMGRTFEGDEATGNLSEKYEELERRYAGDLNGVAEFLQEEEKYWNKQIKYCQGRLATVTCKLNDIITRLGRDKLRDAQEKQNLLDRAAAVVGEDSGGWWRTKKYWQERSKKCVFDDIDKYYPKDFKRFLFELVGHIKEKQHIFPPTPTPAFSELEVSSDGVAGCEAQEIFPANESFRTESYANT